MALRTVGVKLTADVRDYTASIAKSSKDTKGLAAQLNETAKAGDKTAAATVLAGKSARQMADEMLAAGRKGATGLKMSELAAAKLDDQIAETAREVQRLEREFAKTGDFKLVSSLNRQLGLLKRQLKARDMFDPAEAVKAGAEMAGDVSVSFAARLGPLIARAPMAGLNPAALAIGVPLGGAVASLLGAATAGAVIGGAGVGGVVGGLVLASRDARVKQAGAALGTDFGQMMGRSSAVFVPTTLKAIDLVRARMLGLEPQLRRVFAGASRLVEPLVDGAFRGIERLMPGIVRAIENAGPVIDAIADGMSRLGDAVGDVLSDLSDNADEGADALRILFAILDGGVRTLGQAIGILAELWGFASQASAVFTGDMARFGGLVVAERQVRDGANEAADGLRNLGTESMTTAERLQAVKDAFDELFGIQMNADKALIAYHQGLRDLNEELNKGKRSLSVNSEEGLKNRSAVLDQIEAIKQLRDSRIAEGMSITEADGKYQSHLGSLRKTLLAAGYAKSEVDELIGSYRAIPKKVDTTVRANTTPAMTAAAKLRQYLRNIPDETVNIAMRITGNRNASAVAAAIRAQYANRWGGLYTHAEDGLLRDAHIASPMGPARYAYAEPATGGEAFIPRNGDDRRSRAIWEYVGENWLGARPAQPMVVGAGSQRMQVEVIVRADAGTNRGVVQEIVRGIRYEVVNTYGGKTEKAFVTG
ncbi:hypothetical protein ACFP2T_16505 [Plantactinospora solaniradicis]|uniref:Phage tail protein n=1 Tax=Plantactinospora solaniradicis TaxID=1723736 RepID=A0ABW1K866_9ACTN